MFFYKHHVCNALGIDPASDVRSGEGQSCLHRKPVGAIQEKTIT